MPPKKRIEQLTKSVREEKRKEKRVKLEKIVKLVKLEKTNFSNFKESSYNYFEGQQICTLRDMSLREYLEEANENEIDEYLQIVYDAGCALGHSPIITTGEGDGYQLDSTFFDYECWKYKEDNVVDNCAFLRELGHPLFV